MMARIVLACIFLFPQILLSYSDNYPPVLKTRDEQQKFYDQVVAENPWTTNSTIARAIFARLGLEQVFLPGMLQMPQFQAAVKERGAFLNIHVDRLIPSNERIQVMDAETLANIKLEVIAALKQIAPLEEQSLERAVEARLRFLILEFAATDSRGLIIGMINCLPPQERGAIYRLNDPEEQLHSLLHSPLLNDESLKEHFKADAHGILPEQINRDFLLQRAQQLIAYERETLSLLRARWFFSKIGPLDNKAVIDTIQKASADVFDLLEAKEDRVENFFGQVLAFADTQTKVAQHRIQNFLSRTEKSWIDTKRGFEEKQTFKPELYFSIREVPAYLAAHRSCITNDCGSRQDYPFPYSPLERNFFIFTANGNAIAYVGMTYINTPNGRTLYVHDIKGANLPKDIGQFSANAIYQVLASFGVAQMTLGNNYVQHAEGAKGGQVLNQYLDVEIRNYLQRTSGVGSYDMPECNPTSATFIPRPKMLDGFAVRVEKAGQGTKEPVAETPAEILLRFLDVNAGKEVPVQQKASPQELQGNEGRILRTINNADAAPLAEYYRRIDELFSEFELKLSGRFIKRHQHLFLRGHLSAANALTTDDQDLLDQTLFYLILSLKRGEHLELANNLVGQHLKRLSENEEFREFVATTPLIGQQYFTRILSLIGQGLDPRIIAPNSERLIALARTADVHLQTWAINERLARDEAEQPDPEMIAALSTALKNEKHPTDHTSLTAIKLLARFKIEDPLIIKSLRKSVAYEENLEIALLALQTLINNGVPEADIIKSVLKSRARLDLVQTLKANDGFAPVAAVLETACEAAIKAKKEKPE